MIADHSRVMPGFTVLKQVAAVAQEATGVRLLLHDVLQLLEREFRAAWSAAWLFDRDTETWYIGCSSGLSGDAKELRFRRGSALPCLVGERGKPLRVGDLDEEEAFQRSHPLHYRMRSALYVPMAMGRHPLGVIALYSDEPEAFDAEMEELASLAAGQVGFAVACFALRDQRDRRAVIDERDRLAQDLHDGILQTLSSLQIYVSEAKMSLAAGAVPDARSMMEDLQREVAEAIQEARVAIAALRFVDVFERVQDVIPRSQFRLRSAGIDTDAVIRAQGLSPELSDALAAVVREAAQNVLKHSEARRCFIRLETVGEEVVLTIGDDGVGPQADVSPEGWNHFGLPLLRERLGPLNAVLSTGPRPEGGFLLECRAPLDSTSTG